MPGLYPSCAPQMAATSLGRTSWWVASPLNFEETVWLRGPQVEDTRLGGKYVGVEPSNVPVLQVM